MAFTNITELIRSEASDRLLCLCGVRSACRLSDYEYLREIARALPLLQGHPFFECMRDLICKQLQIDLPLTLSNVDQIWRLGAERLWESKIPLTPITLREEGLPLASLPEFAMQEQVRVAYTDEWIHTSARSWSDWESELKHRLDVYGEEPVVLLFSAPLSERVPSRYHVEQALQGERELRDAVLAAQLLRTLLLCGAQSNVTLLVQVREGEEVLLLRHLEHAEALCKLPTVILSIESQASLARLLPLLTTPHQSDVRLGLLFDEITSSLLPQIALQYPLGRVFLYAPQERNSQYFSVFSAKKA